MRTIHHSESTELIMDEEGLIKYGRRLWVLNEQNLRKEMMKEAHSSTYSVPPESTKMYKDLKNTSSGLI